MTFQAPTSNVKDLYNIFKETSQFIGSKFGKEVQELSTKYNFALQEYTSAKLKNLSKIKMAFFSSQVVNLSDIYVPQNLKIGNEIQTQTDFFGSIYQRQKAVITATAGAGKSCFMKSLFISLVNDSRRLVPLFLELRKVNDTNQSIFETIKNDIAIYNSKFNDENLDYLLNRDSTVLLLDGFDEVNYDLKPNYLKEINDLADKHPNLIILISSRPEYNNFTDWTLFDVAKIEPLNLSQAKTVIHKLKYDEDIKNNFVNALDSGIFDKHDSFSSNPLLLTIMLVTYEQFGDIPDQVHIFYDLAFQALFNKHDVSKQSFRRKSPTGLNMYELRDVFSLFCLVTYSRQGFEYTDNEFNELLKNCLNEYNHQFDFKLLKQELLNNVPLIMKDGLDYCFTHRSFQEYFTAYYLIKNEPNEAIFEKIGERYQTDNVVNMMFSMNKKVLEDGWIIPKIDKILNSIPKRMETIEEKVKLVSIFYSSVEAFDYFNGANKESEKHIGYYPNDNSLYVDFLINKYNLENYNEHLKLKYYSEDFTFEEIDFYELYLCNLAGESIGILSLNEFGKELFCRMNGDRNGLYQLELIKYVKKQILKSRAKSATTIESMIFGDN